MSAGYYTLGMIEQYRPDIELIHLEKWESIVEYDWLDRCIADALEKKKIVCIAPWDEDVSYPLNPKLAEAINKYENEAVYWITQFATEGIEWFRCCHNIRLKIIEIQWWLLNDCLAFESLSTNPVPSTKEHKNYLCMLGRYEQHKYQLGKQLHNCGLSQYGTITVAYPSDYPKDHIEFSQTCPVKLYPKLNYKLGKTRSNTKINNVWASANVENYLALQQEFSDIPLVINPDTTCGVMQMTEKLVWPILLGKLFLLYGNAGITASIQRFYDVDISKFANINFDNIVGWTDEINQQRLNSMINDNRNLIVDCQEVYQQLKPELENARVTVGRNFYKFFVEQLEKIQ
jgi:hypothetical protein